jgi:tRNA-specific 2-thiouridylase
VKKSQKKIVYVGMSGGVDSSVSAALLQKAGYIVKGVFIKAWYPDWQECNWRDERRDAMRVCARLNIPFITLDLEKEYKKEVVDYMVREYKAGRTPNPDVMCNKEIKFGHFLRLAKKDGADFIATGHYARRKEVRIMNREFGIKNEKLGVLIEAGKDKEKDQSYFLWTLTEKQLENILFPIGHLRKSEVRRLAKKFNLLNAEKKDSQGLCFIGKVDMKDFLSHYIKPKKGRVLDLNGNTIGSHEGAVFLTIGQRHGFTVRNKLISQKPLYIVQKNIEKNTITVSENTLSSLASSTRAPLGVKGKGIMAGGKKTQILLTGTNWITGRPEVNKTYGVRIRYRQPLQDAKIKIEKGKWLVTFKRTLVDIASGQSLVVYDKNECLGGGVIERIRVL